MSNVDFNSVTATLFGSSVVRNKIYYTENIHFAYNFYYSTSRVYWFPFFSNNYKSMLV